jgi:hypothetical protein
MKSIGKIMEEMGFNPKASTSSKAAFIKHLAKQAYGVDLEIPEIYKSESEAHSLDALKKQMAPEQLEFNLEEFKKVD